MGTWGPGNFDSDEAVDYVSGLVDGFVDTVEQLFAQGRADLDDQGEGKLMPTVEVISVLCDWCRSGAPAIREVTPPHPELIRRWKQQYLEIYDDQIDGLLPSEGFAEERRAHIVGTFDRLEVLAMEGWEEYPTTPS